MSHEEYDIIPPEESFVAIEPENAKVGKELNYNDFINGLLNNPSATKTDKERIVDLLLKEKDKGCLTEGQVRKIIEQYRFTTEEQVQRMIAQKDSTQVSPKNKKGQTNTFFHNPKNMVTFLYRFSKDDDLKWFTHDPEQPGFKFDYAQYIINAKKGFEEKAKGINPSTWYNVQNFIFDTKDDAKDYYDKVIKVRWKDMKKWCVEHGSQHPYDTLVDDYKFSRYIDIFKNTIEFRNIPKFSDRLEDFISDIALYTPDIKTVFSDGFYSLGGQVRVFIDVRQLFFAIKEICKWIIENKSKGNRVEVCVEERPDSYVFSLFHINSYMNVDEEKLKGLSGDFHKVRNILLNVADWTIDADVNNESLHIVCLDGNTKYANNKVISENRFESLPNKVNGVRHSITLYKNLQQ